MKIMPLTDNNISSKGKVHSDIITDLKTLSRNFKLQYAQACETSKNSKLYYENYFKKSKETEVIIKKLTLLMTRFAKSCELMYNKAEGSNLHRFFIKSAESDYKQIIKDVEIPRGFPIIASKAYTDVEEALEKMNPYETNLKFKIMSKHNAKDNFAPEDDFDFLQEKLIR